MRRAAAIAEGAFETGFVEHAYIEPEAGYARRVGDRIEILACTQTPYMDRDEIALIMGLKPTQVRIVPTAVGGGFGGKLDLSLQPLIATAAWMLERPVRCTYTRPESMAATTKRHPARIMARNSPAIATDVYQRGRIPRRFQHRRLRIVGPDCRQPRAGACDGAVRSRRRRSARRRAIYTNDTPAGAFRGFGVPQAAIAHETLMDELAEKIGLDPLEFRLAQCAAQGLRYRDRPAVVASAGLRACLEALRPRWKEIARSGGRVQSARAEPRSAASASPACGTASATRRCPIPRR